jgi:hypothetical protein
MRRAIFMTASSSHAERTEVAANRQPVDPDILDACRSRALPEQVEESFERIDAALRLDFHGAIVPVAHIPLKAQSAGVRLGKIAETDPLNVTQDLRLEAASLIATRQSRVRHRPGRHDHGDPLGRIWDRLKRAPHHRQVGLNQLSG